MGDTVWLYVAHSGVARKRQKMGRGWEVTEIKGPVNLVVNNTDGRVKVVQVNRLQRHIRRTKDGFGVRRFERRLAD